MGGKSRVLSTLEAAQRGPLRLVEDVENFEGGYQKPTGF